jgi:transcriptional regulator with XRE-family HTH domain
MTKSSVAFPQYVPGTSRQPRNVGTFFAQMEAAELQRRRKAMRDERGMTQPEVALAIGVGLRAYQKWEAGGGMKAANRRKLSALWKVPIAELRNDEADYVFASAADVRRMERKLDAFLTVAVRGLQGAEAALALEQALAEAEEGSDEQDRPEESEEGDL